MGKFTEKIIGEKHFGWIAALWSALISIVLFGLSIILTLLLLFEKNPQKILIPLLVIWAILPLILNIAGIVISFIQLNRGYSKKIKIYGVGLNLFIMIFHLIAVASIMHG